MNKKLIIIIAAVVVVVGIAAYVFLFSGKKEEVTYPYVPGEYFVTNVAESSKLLKVAVEVWVAKSSGVDFLTEKQSLVRDEIIRVLRTKTEAQLKEPGATDAVREEIRLALEQKFQVDYIRYIYFTDFVMQ